MAGRTEIDELDLLAYADGLLDDDPMRKARVEQRLRTSPEAVARVESFRAQNEALRQAYASRLSEPVPERLHAILEHRPRPTMRTAAQVAAVFALAVGTGVAGWLIGQRGGEQSWSTGELVDQSYAQFMATGAGELLRPSMDGSAAEVRPLAWLADEVSLRVKAPDLSESGFSLVDKQAITVDGMQMIRLDYAAKDGRAFSLFIAPRWNTDPVEITPAERDGVSLAYWLDGPLASTVVARMPADQTRAIAEAVHDALQSSGSPPAVLDPAPAAPQGPGNGMMADTLANPANDAHPQPLRTPGTGQTKQN